MKSLQATDPLIADYVRQEHNRIETHINLIASENYTPPAVLAALGSVLQNKYAEGYPGKRYYAGCEIVDQVEKTAINRARDLFGFEHVNVQPHSGSQANMAAYFATCEPGDTILAMELTAGGHLTHGHPVNFSGRLYNVVHYSVDKTTERIDYDHIEQLAKQHNPKLIIAGASAYSRQIDFARFAAIAHSVDAILLADIAHSAGLIAAGLHPSPVGHADIITSTTHKTLRGPRGAFIACTKDYAERIDKAVMPGMQGGPFMHVIAAKAVAFHLAAQPAFVAYQQQVCANAQAMAEEFIRRGYRIVSDGTDNHLFILDVTAQQISGKKAEKTLEKIGITTSRSCIPYDTKKPWLTSGIRIGTPAITTRGLQQSDAIMLAEIIDTALSNHANNELLEELAKKTKLIAGQFNF